MNRPTAALALLAFLVPSPLLAASADRCSAKTRAKNVATASIVFEEILSKGLIDENEHIYHPDFVAHGVERDAGRAEDRAASEGWRKMAPDLTMKPLRMVADCSFVAVHWEGTGTNTGEGNGIPATGRKVRVLGMTFFHLKDGRILEEWTSFDQYALMNQLGLNGE